MSQRVAFSCVVDDHPRFRWQCFIFVTTLLHNCGVSPRDIHVHVIGRAPLLEGFLREAGVRVIPTGKWGAGEYCNKLLQFDTRELQDADHVFLCDCDIAFAEDIRQVAVEHPGAIVAKTVDADNPSLAVLEALFQKYDCPIPPVVDTFSGRSFVTNCNGGLLGLPREHFREVGRAWRDFAGLLLADADARHLLDDKVIHIDQISFAMALSRVRPPFIPLGAAFNTPTHCEAFLPGIVKSLAGATPHVLHFHQSLDDAGLLKPVGQEQIDASIEKVNSLLRGKFRNDLFWDYRYAVNPKLGSGIGSRGDLQEYKRRFLKLLGIEKAATVLDVGCGDGEVLAPLHLTAYTGVDISQQAIDLSRAKRPEGKFLLYPERESAEGADFVVCLDVLLHQDSEDDYQGLIAFLARKTKSRLVISGYGCREDVDESCMCRYFEGLRDSLERTGQFRRIFKYAAYRNLDVLVADKVADVFNASANPNDIGESVLEQALAAQSDKDSLLAIVATSRTVFGWYTKHYPRVFEYPWILASLGREVGGKAIADFGAGVSPLPLLLSLGGARVVTVDHGNPVSPESVVRGNEWGFFDYSLMGPAIASVNEELSSEMFSPSSFDAWYSVSVIEHLPAVARREVLRCMVASLKAGGTILLTVDLRKNSDELWNLSAGREVEPVEIHGRLDTLCGELRDLGFARVDARTMMMPETERVDIALVSATGAPAPPVKAAAGPSAGGASSGIPWHRAIAEYFRAPRHIAVIRRSGMFDPAWYLQTYADVRASGIDPVRHYVLHGWREGRDPSCDFSTRGYLREHPEIEEAGACPFMSYIANIDTEGILPPQVRALVYPLDFRSVYEMGNKKTNGVPYSLYYRAHGIDYTSIDLNGLNGALPLDLNEPLDLPARDAVLNIGTSEHVLNQQAMFRNVHRLSRARMIHWVPLAGRHPEHGYWGYDLAFFRELARLNDYTIEKLYIETSFKDWSLVCCSCNKPAGPGRDFTWDDGLPLTFNQHGSGGVSYR